MMRAIGFGLAALVFFIGNAVSAEKSADDIVRKAHEPLKTAKTAEEIKSIEMWCIANLGTLSFPERNRLMTQSVKLMDANKIEEANELIKRVKTLEELDSNLGKLACKPR